MKIIGEKKEIQKFSKDIFVLDKNVVNFSLEKIENCSIIEAYKILYYKRKYTEDFFKLYWNKIWKNSPKYLQKIEIRNRWKKYILIENLIAEYLIKNKEISCEDDWMYVGFHEFSGYRIIVGHGRGIILSRFIPEDIFREIEATKLYLKRLNISEFKFFSTAEEISTAKIFDLDEIFNFAEINSDVKPIFENDHRILLGALWAILSFLLVICFFYTYELMNYHFDVKNSDNKISDKNMSVYVNSKNYKDLKSLLQNLEDNLQWEKIDEFCKQNQIKIEQLKVVEDFAKIKTTISLEKLKMMKNVKIDYSINSDYEELGTEQIVEAVIWLKIK